MILFGQYIDTPKICGNLRAQNGGPDRETEEKRGQELEGRGDASL
jgi:hypothetical protein